MSASFEVQPAALKGAAGTFDAEASAVAEAARTLRGHLGSLATPWGSDVVGKRFGGGYEPAATTVLANVDALAMGIARIAAALRAVADAYQRGDDELLTPVMDESVVAELDRLASGGGA